MANQEYIEAVLTLVEQIPPGRVMSYGTVAEHVRELTGSGSARTVGNVMARYGGAVPWHRVVAANGRLQPGHEIESRQRLIAEGVPFRGPDLDKVDMTRAAWAPDAALQHVGECFNPILDGSRDRGVWLPTSGWSD